MKNLTTTAQIGSFVAEHYEVNLFDRCVSDDDIASVINDLDWTDYIVDLDQLIRAASGYVAERL